MAFGEHRKMRIPEAVILKPTVHQNNGIALPGLDVGELLSVDADLLDIGADGRRQIQQAQNEASHQDLGFEVHGTLPRIDKVARDNVVDLAACDGDVLKLPVIQGAQIPAQLPAPAPLLKLVTISSEEADEMPPHSGRRGKGGRAEGRGHCSASLTKWFVVSEFGTAAARNVRASRGRNRH
ncbi:hypothetical protein [Bradyrhizobium sp. CCBAU 11434]|uniref:hypothetical protein n=1 Tax=Bradyrhizobium sp. CCBAU 11434 TaxID=1630885 RepID=UPI0023050338|nr:hypothetical protein [Bradyrhizobium sp. CCBAU 11434]